MASVDTRVAGWVEIVADLLKEPLTSFPVDLVNRHLDDTFEAEAVAYNYREPDGKSWQQVFTSADRLFAGLELPEALALSQRVLNERGLLNHHPLVRWFAATGNPAAQSWGRVPSAIATSARSAELIERMATYDLLVQMSIPVHLDGVEHAAFVLGRGGKEDFSQEDVAVARRVQPALSALYRQCVVLGGHPLGILAEPLRGCVLTGRELAVLRLLADGLTASAIGRRAGSVTTDDPQAPRERLPEARRAGPGHGGANGGGDGVGAARNACRAAQQGTQCVGESPAGIRVQELTQEQRRRPVALAFHRFCRSERSQARPMRTILI